MCSVSLIMVLLMHMGKYQLRLMVLLTHVRKYQLKPMCALMKPPQILLKYVVKYMVEHLETHLCVDA